MCNQSMSRRNALAVLGATAVVGTGATAAAALSDEDQIAIDLFRAFHEQQKRYDKISASYNVLYEKCVKLLPEFPEVVMVDDFKHKTARWEIRFEDKLYISSVPATFRSPRRQDYKTVLREADSLWTKPYCQIERQFIDAQLERQYDVEEKRLNNIEKEILALSHWSPAVAVAKLSVVQHYVTFAGEQEDWLSLFVLSVLETAKTELAKQGVRS